MIEFTLNRNKNGKKSRWAKKYPRERILKRGSEKAAGWYFHNWLDDDYHHFHGDLHKFLLKNVGRPVDKVFSEFLQRCRKGTEKYNLKELFYDMFGEKEDIDYRGGFYLSNGIINYKKQLLGTFYISTGLYKTRKATVYVAAKLDYVASYFYMGIAKIAEVGLGVGFYVYRAQDGKEYIDPRYTTYSEYKWSSNKKLPDYVFLTKEGD